MAQGLEEGLGQEAPPVARLTSTDTVHAAGGVPVRTSADGQTEVLLIHRPKYDDWTLPKGKLDAGETWEDAAVREVQEETGLEVALGPELPSTEYHDRYGRLKQVRYWAMDVTGGSFHPNREVDEVRWVPIDAARGALSYDRDREVLDALAARKREADQP
jgi:8-oxo-dGTP pyrophosphatase MutT (NUDIX family)